MRSALRTTAAVGLVAMCLMGCDNATYYNTTIEGTALPKMETGTAVTLYLKANAAGGGEGAMFSGRVAGQSQGWLILDTDKDRQVIAADAIARLELPKPTSTSKPPAAVAPGQVPAPAAANPPADGG